MSKRQRVNRVLRRSALALALGMCVSTGAIAQSNAAGSIFGSSAKPGSTVIVQNEDTGFSRTVTADSNGRFAANSLPVGRYKVTLQEGGQTVATREHIAVQIGGGSEVSFAAGAEGDVLDSVVVSGARASRIDVSSTDTRTIFTASDLEKLPVARNVTAVALLAPSVISASSYSSSGVRGGSVPSFGGAAASENAYYINGYPVTNPLTSIGFTELPYDAIDQMQVLTGGYGAEFGRSTGGVINITTKHGTNDWKAGAQVTWTPESLRGTPRNQYYPNTGYASNAATDNQLYAYRNENLNWVYTYGAYVGGPIVQDKLFMYASGEITRQQGNAIRNVATTPNSASGYNTYKYNLPRFAAKIDWNITDNHVVEFTGVGDDTQYTARYSRFNYNGFVHDDRIAGGTEDFDRSRLYIGRYTGYLNDDMTVTALYGRQKVSHFSTPYNYNPNCPVITGNKTAANQLPGITYYDTCQSAATVLAPGAEDVTKNGRLDFQWRLGAHDVRVGIDDLKATSSTGSQVAGGYSWNFAAVGNKNSPIDASNGVGAPAAAGGSGLGVPGSNKGYYVTRGTTTTSATVEVHQAAQYIEDRWQLTDNLLLSLGLRNESFTNYNSDHIAYIEQKNQLAPRIGASWDVRGDSKLKIFGNAGRYFLAVPNQVAVRGASGALNGVEYFTYTGTDPVTGAPTGLTAIPLDHTNPAVCPGTNFVSSNQECGEAPDPRTVAAKNIRPHYQDEFILGMQHELSPFFNYGVKGTYRDLKSAIDDTCAPILGGRCFLFNPGVTNTFQLDNGDGTFSTVTYTREQMGLPKLGRYYYALDLYGEHPFRNNWYARLNYTYSKNFGNTEGQLNSDTDTGAGGQPDVAVTQDWDLPQLMLGANGLLPNNRTHQFKGIGYYQFTPEFRVGATAIVQSGRPRSCTSFYPTADKGLYNGSFYYFCGFAGSGTTPGSTGYVAPGADYRFSPRGTYGETPWTYQLNLNLTYTPNWAHKDLTMAVDVLNVLNAQTPQWYYQRNMTNRTTYNPRFGQELNYLNPRSVRFTVRYDF